jgi:solute carrier family 35 (UDP-sugar transporter), member A1/2/3
MSELAKLLSALVLVYMEEGTFLRFKNTLYSTIVKNPTDTLKICVPSLVYIIQNNLLYLSASHLDAATYQVSLYFAAHFLFTNL